MEPSKFALIVECFCLLIQCNVNLKQVTHGTWRTADLHDLITASMMLNLQFFCTDRKDLKTGILVSESIYFTTNAWVNAIVASRLPKFPKIFEKHLNVGNFKDFWAKSSKLTAYDLEGIFQGLICPKLYAMDGAHRVILWTKLGSTHIRGLLFLPVDRNEVQMTAEEFNILQQGRNLMQSLNAPASDLELLLSIIREMLNCEEKKENRSIVLHYNVKLMKQHLLYLQTTAESKIEV